MAAQKVVISKDLKADLQAFLPSMLMINSLS